MRVRQMVGITLLLAAIVPIAGCSGDEAGSIVVAPTSTPVPAASDTPAAAATATSTSTQGLPTSTATPPANTPTQTATNPPPTATEGPFEPTPTATDAAATETPTQAEVTATPTPSETPATSGLGIRVFTVMRPGSEFRTSALAGFDVSLDPWRPGPLRLEAGIPNASGVASLTLVEDVILGWPVLDNSVACMKFFAAGSAGTVSCNGGVPQSVAVTQDSNGDQNPGPLMTLTGQGSNSPAGSASLTLNRSVVNLPVGSEPADCDSANFAVLEPAAFTTDVASGTVFNAVQSGGTISLEATGSPFDCADWTNPDGPGILIDPVIGLDVEPVGDVVNLLVLSGRQLAP